MVSEEIQYSTIEMPSKNSEGMTIQLRHAKIKDASSLAYMFCTLRKYNSYKFSACEGSKEITDNENDETDNNAPLTDLVENIDQIKEDTDEQSSEYKPTQEEHTERESNDNNSDIQEHKEPLLSHLSGIEQNIISGLGDEKTPPAFVSYVAEIGKSTYEDIATDSSFSKDGCTSRINNVEKNKICGCAIATTEWDVEKSLRILRLQEMFIDEKYVPNPSLLARRVILSFSMLAMETGCAGLSIDENIQREILNTV